MPMAPTTAASPQAVSAKGQVKNEITGVHTPRTEKTPRTSAVGPRATAGVSVRLATVGSGMTCFPLKRAHLTYRSYLRGGGGGQLGAGHELRVPRRSGGQGGCDSQLGHGTAGRSGVCPVPMGGEDGLCEEFFE